jgi:hypothetical protein
MKHRNTISGENAECFNIEAGGTDSNHSACEVKKMK